MAARTRRSLGDVAPTGEGDSRGARRLRSWRSACGPGRTAVRGCSPARAEVGALAVDDAEARAEQLSAHAAVGGDAGGLSAAHHRDTNHLGQDFLGPLRVLRLEQEQPEVATEEGGGGGCALRRRRHPAHRVGADGVECDGPESREEGCGSETCEPRHRRSACQKQAEDPARVADESGGRERGGGHRGGGAAEERPAAEAHDCVETEGARGGGVRQLVQHHARDARAEEGEERSRHGGTRERRGPER
eukprot:scaffold141854_cov23-Tisochrysis_lutea.AAC.1